MNNVIRMPAHDDGKRPEDLYFCERCEGDTFRLWMDGVVMCACCCEETPSIKVVKS